MNRFAVPKMLYRRQLNALVRQALAEDIGPGDRTAAALELGRARARAHLVAKSDGVLAGTDAFERSIRALDRQAQFHWRVPEGRFIRKGRVVVAITAKAAALLTGERTAINFLARLSGVATAAHRLTNHLKGSRTQVLDTRKTTPGWRYLEKRAAALGGAVNHRMNLYDALMIKSNHVVAVGDFAETVRRVCSGSGKRTVICEVRSIKEIHTALELGVRWLLLDHFRGRRLHRAVAVIREFEQTLTLSTRTRPRIVIEVSGNITARTIAAVGREDIDYVSSGSITHSASAMDFSMQWLT